MSNLVWNLSLNKRTDLKTLINNPSEELLIKVQAKITEEALSGAVSVSLKGGIFSNCDRQSFNFVRKWLEENGFQTMLLGSAHLLVSWYLEELGNGTGE